MRTLFDHHAPLGTASTDDGDLRRDDDETGKASRDHVVANQPLVSVETDKAVVEYLR